MRCRLQNPLGQLGDRFHEVFAVVEQEQGVAGPQHVDDRIFDRHPEAGVDPQCSGDRRERRIAVVDCHQLDDEDTVGVVGGDGPCQLHPERRLADTGASDERDQPALAEFLDQCGEELVTADQSLQCDRQIMRRLVRRTIARVAAGWWVRSPVDDPDLGDELVSLAVHGTDHRLPGAVVTDGSTRRLQSRRQVRTR